MRRYLPGIIISSLVILIIGYGGSVIQQHRRLQSSPVSVTVRTTDPMLGPRNAQVTIVEFGDFQCESCKDFHTELVKVRQQYGNRVRVIWKDFPLVAQHPDAYMAAQAARCAQDQGKFWEMHEQLFAHQADLPGRDFTALAKAIEINTESFDRCLRDGLANSRIDEGLSDGQALGVLATPTVIVNSLRFSGIPTAEEIGRAVDQSLQQ